MLTTICSTDLLSLSRLELPERRFPSHRPLVDPMSIIDVFTLKIIMHIHWWIDIYVQILYALVFTDWAYGLLLWIHLHLVSVSACVNLAFSEIFGLPGRSDALGDAVCQGFWVVSLVLDHVDGVGIFIEVQMAVVLVFLIALATSLSKELFLLARIRQACAAHWLSAKFIVFVRANVLIVSRVRMDHTDVDVFKSTSIYRGSFSFADWAWPFSLFKVGLAVYAGSNGGALLLINIVNYLQPARQIELLTFILGSKHFLNAWLIWFRRALCNFHSSHVSLLLIFEFMRLNIWRIQIEAPDIEILFSQDLVRCRINSRIFIVQIPLQSSTLSRPILIRNTRFVHRLRQDTCISVLHLTMQIVPPSISRHLGVDISSIRRNLALRHDSSIPFERLLHAPDIRLHIGFFIRYIILIIIIFLQSIVHLSFMFIFIKLHAWVFSWWFPWISVSQVGLSIFFRVHHDVWVWVWSCVWCWLLDILICRQSSLIGACGSSERLLKVHDVKLHVLLGDIVAILGRILLLH